MGAPKSSSQYSCVLFFEFFYDPASSKKFKHRKKLNFAKTFTFSRRTHALFTPLRDAREEGQNDNELSLASLPRRCSAPTRTLPPPSVRRAEGTSGEREECAFGKLLLLRSGRVPAAGWGACGCFVCVASFSSTALCTAPLHFHTAPATTATTTRNPQAEYGA